MTLHGRPTTISGREARDAFLKDGWTFARQRGSHMMLIKPGHLANLVPAVRVNAC